MSGASRPRADVLGVCQPGTMTHKYSVTSTLKVMVWHGPVHSNIPSQFWHPRLRVGKPSLKVFSTGEGPECDCWGTGQVGLLAKSTHCHC